MLFVVVFGNNEKLGCWNVTSFFVGLILNKSYRAYVNKLFTYN